MREIPSALAEHLRQPATTLARCWRLTRRDGIVMGFTDHDRPLEFDGVTHATATALAAAEATTELGFAIGGGDVSGALAADGLNEADLQRGLYDDAAVEIWLVNWRDPTQRLLLDSGRVGEIRRGESAFVAEIRSAAVAFDEERGRLFTSSCSADLGDARCGVVISPAPGTVASSEGRHRIAAPSLMGAGDGRFTRGRLVFTAGANTGFASEVKVHREIGDECTLEMWQAAPEPIEPGDAFSVIPGCDKSFRTCSETFSNGINFRGFPHLPGNDFVVGGVRSSDGQLDGGSLFR